MWLELICSSVALVFLIRVVSKVYKPKISQIELSELDPRDTDYLELYFKDNNLKKACIHEIKEYGNRQRL